MYLLRVATEQQQAHFRVPYAYNQRHTYPIAPYSTFIGFLTNLLDIYDQRDNPDYENLTKIKISISGKASDVNKRYTHLRNLSSKAHEKVYGSVFTRTTDGKICSIGGLVPSVVFQLYDLRLDIHLVHQDREFLEKLRKLLLGESNNPKMLYLGRSEDIINDIEVSDVLEAKSELYAVERDANYRRFFWVPEYIWMPDGTTQCDLSSYAGLFMQVGTFWRIHNYEKTHNRFERRIFNFMKVKLNHGVFMYNSYLLDTKLNLPVFLADFEPIMTNSKSQQNYDSMLV